MSQRAATAYAMGERPWSKWTKSDLLAAADKGLDEKTIKKLSTYRSDNLRTVLLRRTSWHHTSKMFNETDFYAPHIDADDIPDIIMELDAGAAAEAMRREKADAEMRVARKTRIEYGEWTSSRSHPKLETSEAYAVVVGNWAYLANGRRKKLDGAHIRVLASYRKAPRGTAEEFRTIMARVPATARPNAK